VAAIKLVASGEGEGGNAGRLRGRRGSGSQDAGGGCQALQRNGSLTGRGAGQRPLEIAAFTYIQGHAVVEHVQKTEGRGLP
jgi:hypothetical protein